MCRNFLQLMSSKSSPVPETRPAVSHRKVLILKRILSLFGGELRSGILLALRGAEGIGLNSKVTMRLI